MMKAMSDLQLDQQVRHSALVARLTESGKLHSTEARHQLAAAHRSYHEELALLLSQLR